MGREYEEGKLFSENIDRLLAGEDVATGAEMESDLRTALDFASKMTLLRAAPSPRFQTHLKARLLQKLTEREAAAKQGWFWRLMPREPVWQAAAVLAIMIVVGGVLWGTLFRTSQPIMVSAPTPMPPAATAAPPSTSAPATTAAPTSTSPNMYLRADASIDKSSYLAGETVTIHMVWQNVTSQTLTIDEFPPILSLMDQSSGQPVYTFAAGKTGRTLAPGEKADYIETWDQLDAKGRPVNPGAYYLELEEVYYQGRAVQLNLTKPVSFIILPSPSGTGKTLNLNQSQTINGITVTLQRVELSDNGIIVSAFITPPPDYVLLPGTPVLSATKDYQASAGYSLDGSWVKDIGVSSVEYFGNGMNHTWYIPESVTPETGELTFIVNSLGNWVGPWQFQVSLK